MLRPASRRQRCGPREFSAAEHWVHATKPHHCHRRIHRSQLLLALYSMLASCRYSSDLQMCLALLCSALQAIVAAALAAADSRQRAAPTDKQQKSTGLMGAEEVAEEKAALRARNAALKEVNISMDVILFRGLRIALTTASLGATRWMLWCRRTNDPLKPPISQSFGRVDVKHLALACLTSCCNFLLAQELARWDALQEQQLALTPERPAGATGPPEEDTPIAAEAVAAAQAEAHQQLTLQVGPIV